MGLGTVGLGLFGLTGGCANLSGGATRLFLGAAAGGGSDRFTRLLAAALERVEGIRVIVENEPRAAGLLAVDRLARARPDGQTIGFVPSALLYASASGRLGLPWSLDQFGWLAGIGADTRVMVLNTRTTGAFAEVVAKRTRITLASNTTTSTNHIEARLVSHLTGARLRPVPGYDGGSRSLAFLSGEVDGAIAGLDAIGGMLGVPGARIVLKLNDSAQGGTDVPQLGAFARGPDREALLAVISATARLGRLFALPPNCPTEVRRLWIERFARVLADAAFQAACAAQDFAVDYLPADAVEQTLAGVLSPVSPTATTLARVLETAG